MSILDLVAVCIAAWWVVSVPLALVAGRVMRACVGDSERRPAQVLLLPTQDEGVRSAA